MRLATLLLLAGWKLAAQSSYEVFDSDNFQGVLDEQEQVLVPAVYEKIGWSDGTTNVIDELIGFKENGKWGLINVSNKKVSEARFDKLEPFLSGSFRVAIQGKFTNRFFYGLIDQRGKIILNLNYFELLNQSGTILVTTYEDNQFLMGMLKADLSIGVGIIYQEIDVFGHLLIGERQSKEFDVYSKSGQLLEAGLHGLKKQGENLITTRNGSRGLISSKGEVVHAPIHKEIKSYGRVTPFPKWEIRTDAETLNIKGDSVSQIGDNLWMTHSNGSSRFFSKSLKPPMGGFLLRQSVDRMVVIQSTTSGDWAAYNFRAEPLLRAADSIHFNGKYLYAKNEYKWSIHNQSGILLSDKKYDAVIPQISRYQPVRKFNYWAVFDAIDQTLSDFRYDSISQVIGSKMIVKYVGHWGVYYHGRGWLIQPKYDKIEYLNDHFLGRKGGSDYIFNPSGRLLFQTIDEIKARDDHFILTYRGKFSVLNDAGRPVANTVYRSVTKWGDHYEMNLDFVDLVTSNGKKVVQQKDQIQDVLDFSEGYFLIKKNNNFGFVDANGNLRIANRYDSAKRFSDGLAAIKLREKWGFIDKAEQLVVQPYYQWVSTFENGRAIFISGEYYGLLDKEGHEVLAPEYLSIARSDFGNYVMKSKNGTYALADSKGITFLSGAYENLEDVGNSMVIGTLSGKKGILNYSGQTIANFSYSEIVIGDTYTLLKKMD